jgi:hypothetical protein
MIYKSAVQVSFPPVWRAMLAKDAGFTSFEAYQMQRTYAGIPTEFGPPRRWVQRYISLVNSQAWDKWRIRPNPAADTAELHESSTLQNHPSLDGEKMDLNRIVYIDFEAALRWHILHASSAGHDLSPYLRSSGNSPGKPDYRALTYKLAFDTTETGSRPLLMIGLIPHVFAKRAVQSADNVIVLCLAKISEDRAILQEAIPDLPQTVKLVEANGISFPCRLTFNVEIHIAADLKALWVAMDMTNFGCPFCVAQKGQFGLVLETFAARFMNNHDFILGVPKERVHLCALHAHLRIAERFLKNAALRCVNKDHTDRANKRLCSACQRKLGASAKLKSLNGAQIKSLCSACSAHAGATSGQGSLSVTRLKNFIRRFLKRTKFVITGQVKELGGESDLMEDGTAGA